MQAITYRGLKVHLGTRADTLHTLSSMLTSGDQHQVVTLNPEYVVLAARNPRLVALTQHASLCLVDGMGLALAVQRFGVLERYPGADIVPDLLRFCAANKSKVGVVLSRNGLSTPKKVVENLTKQFTGLHVAAWSEHDTLKNDIEQFQPNLLLVTFGQPRQDTWIADHLSALPSIRVAIGIGGAIDFLTGARRRAPRVMRMLGVEWLWRLVTQPWRFTRIVRATFGFWYTILFR